MAPDAPLPGYGNASWPNVSNPLAPTAADHAAHTTRKGIPYPGDLGMTRKQTSMLLKAPKIMKSRSGKMPTRSTRGPKRKKKL